jgi:hypothetical protein
MSMGNLQNFVSQLELSLPAFVTIRNLDRSKIDPYDWPLVN